MSVEKIDEILKAVTYAFEKFKNASSMLDAERANELTLKYAKRVDYIVGSERFAKDYTGLDVVEENYQEIITQIRKLNNKHVVITLGDKGLIYEKDGVVYHMDAYKVDVVDTTGAGDIFHGAFSRRGAALLYHYIIL